MERFNATRINQLPSLDQRKRAASEYVKGRFFADRPEAAEQTQIMEMGDVPERYRAQANFQSDPSAALPLIAVIPNAVWKKSQPTESAAEQNLILFRSDYWEGTDEIAWLTHERGHCERFQALPTTYASDQQQLAIEDVGSEYPYPNNKVEEYAFTKQFEFLKQKGAKREEVQTLLAPHYPEPSEVAFLGQLLDRVYSQK